MPARCFFASLTLEIQFKINGTDMTPVTTAAGTVWFGYTSNAARAALTIEIKAHTEPTCRSFNADASHLSAESIFGVPIVCVCSAIFKDYF